ncbi:anti-sigma factor family protein [Rhodohalobacter mucosus]|uniref:Uncharacterized protein n=1 Tax=Rhodohalobacter mucosus TaxID=2079485 RepID=A0A316TS33_9BACT|nr:hypothetical protein [Rhodohalobacter mucosus]PWN06441.1 hypothetical protein DDZ15_07910 [Rhodohalobacter mucosus]
MIRLTKKQALDILPAVVDGEASDELRMAFMAYIESDPDVREEYEDAMMIKKLLSEKLRRLKAPEHLKKNVHRLIEEMDQNSSLRDMETESESISESSGTVKDDSFTRTILYPTLRYLAAAAVILFITLTTLRFLDRMDSADEFMAATVEDYTAVHFANTSGKAPTYHFATSSEEDAEQYLIDHHGVSITVPKITGAKFAGVFMSDFYNGMKAPLLEYQQPDINESIFLFAFSVNEIDQNRNIVRNREAVEKCVKTTDFHIAEVDSRHVLSWKWEDNWYTAVSNHNGHDLAALIEPLNYASP